MKILRVFENIKPYNRRTMSLFAQGEKRRNTEIFCGFFSEKI